MWGKARNFCMHRIHNSKEILTTLKKGVEESLKGLIVNPGAAQVLPKAEPEPEVKNTFLPVSQAYP